MEFSSSLPSTVRRWISQEHTSQPTYGWCKGFLQANIMMIPSRYADAFEKFCTLNRSACPLLYRSKRGEVSAPPLADESDIRTELTKYWHLKDGKFHEELLNVKQFEWNDMITFYLGCSFGLEDALQRAGIYLPRNDKNENNANVSMYVTNIRCNPSPPFSANMVVSMRPIPVKLVQAVYEATYKLDCAHGAPVHIGDPSDLGIPDIRKVDYGVQMDIGSNEVAVFWACGVTGIRSVQSAALPQCFSHSPGCMFICDVEMDKFQDSFPSPFAGLSPQVVQLSDDAQIFSVLSEPAKKKIETLERLLLHDIGDRGVNNFSIMGDLLKSSLRLYQAVSVGITTGFPCFPSDPVSEETDGIPGAVSIAKALCALGKDVSLIVDRRNEALAKSVIRQCVASGILKQTVPILVYERWPASERELQAVNFLYSDGTGKAPRFDHLISIERTGPAEDGKYRNTKGGTLGEELIAPVEDLFRQAMKDNRMATSSIGDGGNELGMGKVKEKVKEFVKHGESIACEVASDYLITAGVSNWGGYALAVAMHVLSTCPVHLRYARRGIVRPDMEQKRKEDFVNSVEQEEEILGILVSEGVRDGITGKLEKSVDGFTFYPHHVDLINKLHQII